LLPTDRMTVHPKSFLETDASPVPLSISEQCGGSPPSKRLRLSLKGQRLLGSTSNTTKSEKMVSSISIYVVKPRNF
jgi:hypothetical protein